MNTGTQGPVQYNKYNRGDETIDKASCTVGGTFTLSNQYFVLYISAGFGRMSRLFNISIGFETKFLICKHINKYAKRSATHRERRERESREKERKSREKERGTERERESERGTERGRGIVT